MNKSNQLKRPQRRGWPAAKEGETKWRPLGGSNRFIDGAFNSIQIQISDIPRRMASQVSGETESGIRDPALPAGSFSYFRFYDLI